MTKQSINLSNFPCLFSQTHSSPLSSHTCEPIVFPLQTTALCFNYPASSNFHLLLLHLSPPTIVTPLSLPFKQTHCVSTTMLLPISIFFFFTFLLLHLSPYYLSPSNKRIMFQLPCFFQFPSSSLSFSSNNALLSILYACGLRNRLCHRSCKYHPLSLPPSQLPRDRAIPTPLSYTSNQELSIPQISSHFMQFLPWSC